MKNRMPPISRGRFSIKKTDPVLSVAASTTHPKTMLEAISKKPAMPEARAARKITGHVPLVHHTMKGQSVVGGGASARSA